MCAAALTMSSVSASGSDPNLSERVFSDTSAALDLLLQQLEESPNNSCNDVDAVRVRSSPNGRHTNAHNSQPTTSGGVGGGGGNETLTLSSDDSLVSTRPPSNTTGTEWTNLGVRIDDCALAANQQRQQQGVSSVVVPTIRMRSSDCAQTASVVPVKLGETVGNGLVANKLVRNAYVQVNSERSGWNTLADSTCVSIDAVPMCEYKRDVLPFVGNTTKRKRCCFESKLRPTNCNTDNNDAQLLKACHEIMSLVEKRRKL